MKRLPPYSPSPIAGWLWQTFPRVPQTISRYEAWKFMLPMRQAFAELREGEVAVDERGYPLTRLDVTDRYERIDECIAGFLSLAHRLAPDIDTSAMWRVQNKLTMGVLLVEADLDRCDRIFDAFEVRLMALRRDRVNDVSMIEQIEAAQLRLQMTEKRHGR